MTSVNAHAIGKTEKGVLIGMGSMLLLPSMFENAGKLFGSNYSSSNSTRVITHEPPRERVVYKTRVIEREPTVIYKTQVVEKVYYEPRRYRKHHHRKAHRSHNKHYERYAYRH